MVTRKQIIQVGLTSLSDDAANIDRATHHLQEHHKHLEWQGKKNAVSDIRMMAGNPNAKFYYDGQPSNGMDLEDLDLASIKVSQLLDLLDDEVRGDIAYEVKIVDADQTIMAGFEPAEGDYDWQNDI